MASAESKPTPAAKKQVRITQCLTLPNRKPKPRIEDSSLQTPPKTVSSRKLESPMDPALKEKLWCYTTRFSGTGCDIPKPFPVKSSPINSPVPLSKNDEEYYKSMIKDLRAIIKQKDNTISELQKRVQALHKQCETLRKNGLPTPESGLVNHLKSLNSTTTLASLTELKADTQRSATKNSGTRLLASPVQKTTTEFYSPKGNKRNHKRMLSESLIWGMPHYFCKSFLTPCCKSPEVGVLRNKTALEKLKKRLVTQLFSMKAKIEELSSKKVAE